MPSKKTLAPPPSPHKLLLDAQRFMQQANYTQALYCYRQVYQTKSPETASCEIAEQIHLCQMQLLRRFARQGKEEQFITARQAYGWQEHFCLTLARMQGHAALKALATLNQGLDSELASCSLEKDLKTALMRLRRIPLYKEMAEGWICLLKGDLDLARHAFETAAHKVPCAARVGSILLALVKGDCSTAEQALQPIHTHACPQLAQAIRHATSSFDKEFRSLFYSTSSQIESALQSSTLKRMPKCMQGWLHLRAGDLLWSEHQTHDDTLWTRISTHWTRAEELHPALAIDVAKRRLFLAYKELPSFLVKHPWQHFCQLVHDNDPKQLEAYLRLTAHTQESDLPPIPLCAFLNVTENKAQPWLLKNPPPPFYLLLCRLIAQQLRCIEHALQVPAFTRGEAIQFICRQLVNEEEYSEENAESAIRAFMLWQGVQEVLPDLDQTYIHNPLYLQARYVIARTLNDAATMRSITYWHVLTCPEQKNILLPRYMAALLQELSQECQDEASSCLEMHLHQSNDHVEILAELKALHEHFLDDYDVTRLLILCQDDDNDMHQRVVTHAGHLSGILATLLYCQLLIDTKMPCKAVLEALPKWEACQGNPAAQERWLHITISSLLQSEQMWGPALNSLSVDQLHLILKRIQAREPTPLPIELIEALRQNALFEPYIRYHESLNLLRSSSAHDDRDKALAQLEQYLCQSNGDHPDAASVISTLRVYTAAIHLEKM